MMSLPILYSYRRCPYAMRARLALHSAEVETEIREIDLRAKPRHMLRLSPKGTVPVLVLSHGQVIEESLEIMFWALQQHDPGSWLTDQPLCAELIAENDGSFKQALDRYKYASRFPERSVASRRLQCEPFLGRLERALEQHAGLLGAHMTLADVALFPFIRQFSMVDSSWFATAPYPRLRRWLERWLQSPLFLAIMHKHPTWQEPPPELDVY